MINKISINFLTMFGIGYSKFAPGTIASFITTLVFYLLFKIGYLESRGLHLIYIVIVIFFLGILVIDKFSSFFNEVDAQEIVIDEFVGQNVPLLTLLFIPFNMDTYDQDFTILIILSFIIFRFFDIIKPYPINLIDTKMKDGIGVMLDDLVAGIFSAIIIYLIAYLCF
jgi:phosphatidylglycerophosphatase A